MSANLGKKARQEDYDYLAAVTARNWYNFGFIPIIVIVASSIEEIYDTVDLWNIILPTTRGGDHNHNRDRDDNTIIIPLVVQHHPQHQVAIAQVSRLFAVSSLVGADLLLRDEDFVRITDADMMILNPIPFEPPDDNTTDITIFNGNCCGPHEYPMHSVGMKVRLFRTIFPVTVDHHHNHGGGGGLGTHEQQQQQQRIPPPFSSLARAGAAILSQFYNWTETRFPNFSSQATMKHGGKNWGMDQLILAEKINEAVEQHGYKLKKEPGPRGRLHISGNAFDASSSSGGFTDAHLSSFSLSSHGQWLDGVVNNTVVLFGNRQGYYKYTQAWKDHKKLQKIMQNQTTTNSTSF